MTAQTTSNNWVIGPPTNTNPQVDPNAPTNPEQSEADFDRPTLIMRAVCAWLVISFFMLLIVRQIEIAFGVLSGLVLLVGPYPAVLSYFAVIFGVAAYIASATHAGLYLHRALWWLRFGWRTTPTPHSWQVVEAEQPAPTLRRERASQRVMDMEL